MALTQIFDKPYDYIALSTDISENVIAGATKIGGLVYLLDSKLWKIIQQDGTLAEYKLPISPSA